jgi:hypothetical protein
MDATEKGRRSVAKDAALLIIVGLPLQQAVLSASVTPEKRS